jgi:hypothetical protein
MVLILDFINDMLPIRSQNIAILSLETLCNILESRVELRRSRNISTLRDLTSGAEMAAIGLRIVRKGRSTRHLLLWPTLLRPIVLIWIHFLQENETLRRLKEWNWCLSFEMLFSEICTATERSKQ